MFERNFLPIGVLVASLLLVSASATTVQMTYAQQGTGQNQFQANSNSNPQIAASKSLTLNITNSQTGIQETKTFASVAEAKAYVAGQVSNDKNLKQSEKQAIIKQIYEQFNVIQNNPSPKKGGAEGCYQYCWTVLWWRVCVSICW